MIRKTIGGVILLVLSLFTSPPVVAGGDYFQAEVLDFRALGNDEYRIVLRQMTGVYGSDEVAAEPLVIYLRHDETAMRREHGASKEKYLAAIELLKQQIAQSTLIRFGVIGGMGTGRIIPPIDGKPGEFQSNSLEIYEGVVYSLSGDT
jgi:hypothetical protein